MNGKVDKGQDSLTSFFFPLDINAQSIYSWFSIDENDNGLRVACSLPALKFSNSILYTSVEQQQQDYKERATKN